MIERILVPVDFSNNSLKALDYAVAFAKPFKAEITALFVVEPIYYSAPDITGGAATMAGLMEEQRRHGRTQLQRLEQRYAKSGVALRALLQTGTAYQAIADTAKQIKADLIVMTTHGRTGMSHLLMGSVAERVVRSAPCPVLTFNPSKQRRRVAPRRAGGRAARGTRKAAR
jgi:universal stress protein A